MNPFFHVTSKGGYFGRFAWDNGDPSLPQPPGKSQSFGVVTSINSPNITGQAWAGGIWVVRSMIA